MIATREIKFAFLVVGSVIFIGITNATNSSDVYLRGSLQGKELRVVTGHFPPYISILRNSSGHITGYSHHMYHLLLYLSQKLKFTYKIFPARENTLGVKNNGIWNGVIGAVANLEADIGLLPLTVSLERYEAIEFCGFVRGDNTGILVKYPDANISFTSAFDVFSIGIWIGGISSGIGICALSVIFSYLTKRLRINDWPAMSAEHFLWHLYGTTISQGVYFPCRQPSQKLLVATWCFATFVFVNIYNSTLRSYMSVTYQRPEINSFRDLATATNYKATVLIGSIQDIDLRVVMEVYLSQYII
ncbi:glutamate receptor ionotropic, delta-2-like [Daphnia pulex]|uniref:glutamate receptor ionotropic, delta-2-like n=1 Tax=Daphnia pulex TaxID=6669 RepID=UPI001EDD76E6|nr:glutamate receptor ionotropic, delta-2-like [Daphnia pulex]